ncbi:unnamed protein product [Microthlaspi erraticum]|uniref:Uncharacterized protein n=1 Tax=Microthlaspi erraticum TaxID=1685480 RepID=A0A6D2HN83_9BRAS|nr:unnamed protein product [Microthlaspi erraticum]
MLCNNKIGKAKSATFLCEISKILEFNLNIVKFHVRAHDSVTAPFFPFSHFFFSFLFLSPSTPFSDFLFFFFFSFSQLLSLPLSLFPLPSLPLPPPPLTLTLLTIRLARTDLVPLLVLSPSKVVTPSPPPPPLRPFTAK